MVTTTKTAVRRLICITILLIIFLPLKFSGASAVANAADGGSAFDKTDVLSDLNTMSIEGETFNAHNYPYNENGTLQLLNFVEYAYSAYVNARDHYGLYVYIYNPRALDIATGNGSNKIQMASAYDENGEPSDYEKFGLKFCSVSADKLFYKFKVIDQKSADGKTIAERVKSNERRYDISGIDIARYDNPRIKNYPVERTYKFTGFAKGYDASSTENSTLAGTYFKLETISLSVKNTNYKTGYTGSSIVGYQSDINSVYFSIDNDILDEYGSLYGIKAEWYAYQTPQMLVIDDSTLYNKLLPYNGVIVPWSAIAGCSDNGLFNAAPLKRALDDLGFDAPAITNLRFYFYLVISAVRYDTQGVLAPAIFSTHGADAETYTVSFNELQEYIENYNKSYLGGKVYIGDREFSADLLTQKKFSGVGIDTEYGKITKEITLDDTFDIKIGEIEQLVGSGIGGQLINAFYKVPQGYARPDIVPIQELNSERLQASNAADTYLINPKDLYQIQNDVRHAQAQDKTTFIYHYSLTPYVTAEFPSIIGNDPGGYVASQAMIYDFTIIHLTFKKADKLTVIPVAMDPIDVINDITPPPYTSDTGILSDIRKAFESFGDWFKGVGDWFADNWKIIVGVVAGAIGLIVIVTILVKIFGGKGKTKVTVNMPAAPAPKPKKTKRKTKSVKRKESK